LNLIYNQIPRTQKKYSLLLVIFTRCDELCLTITEFHIVE